MIVLIVGFTLGVVLIIVTVVAALKRSQSGVNNVAFSNTEQDMSENP